MAGNSGKAAAGWLRYFVSAASGVLVDWAVWAAVWRLTGDPVAAQVASRLAGAVLAFAMYRNYAFKGQAGGRVSRQAARFVLAAAAAWAVSVALVASLAAVLPDPVAKIAADGVTFVANYFVLRRWVFVGDQAPAGRAAGA